MVWIFLLSLTLSRFAIRSERVSSGAPSRAGKSSLKSMNSFRHIFSASLRGTSGVFTPTAIAAVPDAWLSDPPWLVPIPSANGMLGESECLLVPLPSFAALVLARERESEF